MANVVCTRCEDLVKVRRVSSPTQLAGLLMLIVGAFIFWPIALIGFLMMFSGSKKTCPQCRGDQIVPPGSAAGMRIMEDRVARLERRRLSG